MGNTENMQEFSWLLVSHPILKNSEIHPQKNLIKTTVHVMDEYQLQTWITGLQKIKATNCSYLFTPESYSIASRDICGNSCTIKLRYQNYPYLLMQEIINRCKIDQKFQQNELWYLLLVLTEVANSCLSIQGKIGDVRPHNILFNQSGQLKIIHRYTYPGQITNFQKTLLDKVRTFLSPQEMRLIYSHKTFNNTNFQISQSFSIGMTLLCAIFLEDMSYIYDLNQMTINENQLSRKLSELPLLQFYDPQRQLIISYSQEIISMICRLLDPTPSQRMSSIDLYKWLKPFSKQIINFQNFKFQIIDRTYSISGIQTELYKNTQKFIKDTRSIDMDLKSKQSMENKIEDLQIIQEQIPHDHPVNRSKITRALTISQKAIPLYENKELEPKNQMTDAKNMVKIHYDHPISNPIQQQSQPSFIDIKNSRQVSNHKVSQTQKFLAHEPKQNQNRNIFITFSTPNKILEMKDKQMDENIKRSQKLKVQDLEDYIPNKDENYSMSSKMMQTRKYAKIEDAAVSVNSTTPVSNMQSGQKIMRNDQKLQFNKKYMQYMNSQSKNKSQGKRSYEDQELLMKLDEQLQKSKKLFPDNGNI